MSGGEPAYGAWLVDLDGTLYDSKWIKLAMAAELAFVGWGSIRTLRRFRHEHELLREEGASADSPFLLQAQRTAQALGSSPSDVEHTVREWMIERPAKWLRRCRRESLVTEIEQFRRGGGKTALVSDYPAEVKLRALELDALFDVTVANGEPGGPNRLKPAPDGYSKAARALGVPAEQCLVIGDREDADGAAARAAGMHFRLVR